MSFVKQSQSAVMQNQSKHEIPFDNQLKTALIGHFRVTVDLIMKASLSAKFLL